MFIAGSRKSPAYERGEKNMQNKDSETGMAEDLLRSIVQLGAAEIHLQTLYNKSRAELENGSVSITMTFCRSSSKKLTITGTKSILLQSFAVEK